MTFYGDAPWPAVLFMLGVLLVSAGTGTLINWLIGRK